MASTVSKWAGSVDEKFKFSFKVWKEITHIKNLNFEESNIEIFLKAISGAGEKKGCLLIQFPPGLGVEAVGQLDKLLYCFQKYDNNREWSIAVEFRNKTWYNDKVYTLLENYHCTLVIHDKQASATPWRNEEAPFLYLRLHGPTGNYRGSYTEDFLTEYAEYIRVWRNENKMVFIYFNNTMGEAFSNLQMLNKLVGTNNNS